MAALKIRMRFDYPGQIRSGRLFGNKPPEQLAADNRENRVSTLRNIPLQGIHIADIDMSLDIYTVIDEISGKRIAYAPVMITLAADGIEDAVQFAAREEFRTIEVLEPQEMILSSVTVEKVFFKISQEMAACRENLARKMDNWK
jgi:hypothetical protein